MSFEFLNKTEKWELAQFVKRVSFDTALKYSEGHGEEQKNNAYFLLRIFSKVQQELADQGFASR